MALQSIPIYGELQYQHTGFLFRDNPDMDITQTIAANLTALMDASPSLDTLKKLAAKSRVGSETIRRARNGDGNITVQNLEAIARAFGRHAADLIASPETPYARAHGPTVITAAESNVTRLTPVDPLAGYLGELTALATAMSDEGRWQLIGQAKLLAATHPKAKANPAS